jgi:hypothetical protein
MQGMMFVILNDKAQAINHGTVTQAITPEKYLCKFNIPAAASRIVSLEDLQAYTLFNNPEQMNAFMAAIQPKPEPKTPAKKTGKKKVRKSK